MTLRKYVTNLAMFVLGAVIGMLWILSHPVDRAVICHDTGAIIAIEDYDAACYHAAFIVSG